MANFPGTSQRHRAEVLAARGNLVEAEQEVILACERLSSVAPWAEGDASRVLGDLRLARGEIDEAETAFRRAHELGGDPQPGLARVLAARGDAASGIRSLERSLADRGWTNRERRGLPLSHLAILAAEAGDVDRAREALDDLHIHAELCATASLQALKEPAEVEVTFAEGDVPGAVAALRRSTKRWLDFGSSLQASGDRPRLALFLVADGDRPSADLELRAAEAVFARYELPAMMRHCRTIRRSLFRRKTSSSA